jgi:hypothetical protein
MQGYRPAAVAVLVSSGLLTTGCSASTSTRSAPSTVTAVSPATAGSPANSTRTTSAPSSPATGTASSTAGGGSSSSPAVTSTSPPMSTGPSREPNSPASRAGRAQVPASRLPGFNAEWRWTSTGELRTDPSPCLVTTLEGIGAAREAGHSYRGSTAARTDQASQLTGVFPDEHTAITAEAVLTAWHDKCAARARQLKLQDVHVTEMRDVPTTVGTAWQWLLTYGPVPGEPHARWFVSQGFVRDGDTITVMVYRSAGQDYNYPPGREPVDQGLQVAAKYLKATR